MKYLDPNPKESKNLADDDMLTNATVKFRLKADVLENKEEGVVKKEDGSDYFQYKPEGGTLAICNMKGDYLAFLVEGQRHTEINGCECVMNLPHMYVYSFTPYLADGQKASEFKIDGKPLYAFARIHADAIINPMKKVQSYEICYAMSKASNADGKEPGNASMFNSPAFLAKRRKADAEVAIKRDDCFKEGMSKRKSYGACVAKTDPADSQYRQVTIGANVDPVMMACCVLVMEKLEFKL